VGRGFSNLFRYSFFLRWFFWWFAWLWFEIKGLILINRHIIRNLCFLVENAVLQLFFQLERGWRIFIPLICSAEAVGITLDVNDLLFPVLACCDTIHQCFIKLFHWIYLQSLPLVSLQLLNDLVFLLLIDRTRWDAATWGRLLPFPLALGGVSARRLFITINVLNRLSCLQIRLIFIQLTGPSLLSVNALSWDLRNINVLRPVLELVSASFERSLVQNGSLVNRIEFRLVYRWNYFKHICFVKMICVLIKFWLEGANLKLVLMFFVIIL